MADRYRITLKAWHPRAHDWLAANVAVTDLYWGVTFTRAGDEYVGEVDDPGQEPFVGMTGAVVEALHERVEHAEQPAPGQGGHEPPGHSGEAPGHSGEAPGHSGDAPGHTGELPDQAKGKGTPGGGKETAPGQTGEAGKSGEAPGHQGGSPGRSGEEHGKSTAPGQRKKEQEGG